MQNSGAKKARRGAPGRRRFGLGTILLLIVLFGGWVGPVLSPVVAQLTKATVSVIPADVSVAAGKQFEVTVEVDGIQDLGGFQLTLRYDPALVQVNKVTLGEFIGSTERDVVPLGPAVDSAAGQVSVGAFTSGTAAGPKGKGVLVMIACTAMQAGQGTLGLTDVVLSDTKAAMLPVTTVDGKVSLTGDVVVPTATSVPATPTTAPATPTATAVLVAPTDTAAAAGATPGPGTPTPVASATPGPGTPAPEASATVEPLETLMSVVATQTAQAWRTAEAQWTPTPTAIVTPDLAATAAPELTVTAVSGLTATAAPGEAATEAAILPAATSEPVATPTPGASAAGSGAGLGIGLGVVAVALGAGGVYLWRRGRRKSS